MLEYYFFVDSDESTYARHKYMYDFSMILDILTGLGFKNIVRRSYQEGMTPDISVLDNRPEEFLFVETQK